ncbi:MAG: hypothetical protein LUH05_02700 [Candidatus Gastranaerophilales bacterium]|nr:hypothetical protein [Candidatus Gastranaerophilales bacterium]
MADISIGKSLNKDNIQEPVFEAGEYFSQWKKYQVFMEKAAKSDFVNSPVLMQKELELLASMQKAAEEEGLSDEIAFIQNRIAQINEKSKEAQNTYKDAAYYTDIHFSNDDVQSSSFSKLLESCKNSKGVIDENTSRIIQAYKNSDIDEYHLSYLLKKCREDNDEISPDKVEAIEILAAAGVSLSFAAQILDEFSESCDYTTIEEINGEQKEKTEVKDIVNLEACQKLANYKSMGFQDLEALNFVRLVNGNFQDEEEVNSYIKKLRDSKILPEYSIQILKNLAVENDISSDNDKNLKKIVPSAINSVITLKKSMIQNRDNEERERNNPSNNKDNILIDMGDTYMFMEGEGYNVQVISSPQSRENIDEDIEELKQKYEKAISQIEDNLLVEFTSKYKENDGSINSNALRTTTALRRSGVTYDNLLPLTEFCLADGAINSDKMKAVTSLKKSGCLGSDIIEVLDSLNKTPEGQYDKEDLQSACEFSSSGIGGKNTVALVNTTRGSKEVKEFFMDLSPCFEDKSNLVKLIPLIKNEEGIIDETAMEILYNLAENFFGADYNMNDEEFIDCANDIIYKAMDNNEILVSDDSAGICSIMCQNKQSPEEIIAGLEVCKDKSGNVDSKLADVLWEMSLLNADINQITTFINTVCKDENGNPNHFQARKMTEAFQQGKSLEEMMKFV